MAMSIHRAWFATTLVVAPLFACASPLREFHIAEDHAPSDLGCPREKVTQYRHASLTFQGCGRWVRYHCMTSPGGSQCVAIATGEWQDLSRPAP